MVVRFELNERGFRCVDAPVLANASSINYLIAQFNIAHEAWQDVTAITAVFKSATYNIVSEVMLDSDNRCYIDPEIYRRGGNIQVKLVGDKYVDDRIVSSTDLTEIANFYIKENVILPTPIPSKSEVVVAEFFKAAQAVEDVIALVEEKLENGDFDGADGEDGVGIVAVAYNSDGTVTVTLSDSTEFTSEYSMKGQKGDVGTGIALVTYQQDGTLVITMTDGTQYVSEYSMRGEQGPRGVQGIQGETGNGIESITKSGTSGLVDTYTVLFTDDTTTTFTVTNGAKGDKGDTGAQGPKGDTGATGPQGIQGIKGDTGNGIASIEKTSTTGLVDTYTIEYTDGTTDTFDVTNGEDGEVTEEALEETLEEYAKIDGYYEEMSVGNAEQLISSIYEENQAPYLRRPTGGALEVGDRAYMDAIIGGTVAWNQLVRNGNFADTSGWSPAGASLSVSNNIGTIVSNANYGRLQQTVSATLNHKYLFCGAIKSSSASVNARIMWADTDTAHPIITEITNSTDWVNISKIVLASRDTTNTVVIGSYLGAGTIYAKDIYIIDLTALFGSSTIADYLYSLEQTTAGSGIAKLKGWGFDIDSYHAYDAGSLQSVGGLVSHDTVGFNQWDEEWELGNINNANGANADASNRWRCKNYIPVIPNASYYLRRSTGAELDGFVYDKNKNYMFTWVGEGWANAPTGSASISNRVFTIPDGCYYFRFKDGGTGQSSYQGDICLNISKTTGSPKNGDYVPYEKHSYPLDSSVTLRGIYHLDAQNRLYADGDVYEPSGQVGVKYGIVDLGECTYGYNSSLQVFYTYIGSISGGVGINTVPEKKSGLTNYICKNYISVASTYQNLQNGQTVGTVSGDGVNFKNTQYTDVASFKTAMSGVYLVYELATPTTETADPYRELQIVDNYGTEEFIDYAYSQGDRDIAVPVGHITRYTPDLVSKLEELPNPPSGNGDYIMRRSGGTNAYTPLVIPQELPNTPSEDGTYKLVCTVSSGTATLSWESEV